MTTRYIVVGIRYALVGLAPFPLLARVPLALVLRPLLGDPANLGLSLLLLLLSLSPLLDLGPGLLLGAILP